MNILIVEDYEPVALILSTLLRSMGNIATVRTLTEAYQAIAKSVPDLMLLDLNLPDSGAYRTLDAVRGLKEKVSIVVVMTGAILPDLAATAIAAGADACVYKGDPALPQRLQEAMKSSSKSPFPDTAPAN